MARSSAGMALRSWPEGRRAVNTGVSSRRTEPLSRAWLKAAAWSLDILGRRFPSPGGRFENSPAAYCRVQIRLRISPEGTAESLELIQPSLRDGKSFYRSPTLERVGYCQISLREMGDETAA